MIEHRYDGVGVCVYCNRCQDADCCPQTDECPNTVVAGMEKRAVKRYLAAREVGRRD